MFPAARIGDPTVTGDFVIGPCVPNVLIGGLPAAVLGDMVQGALINASPGTITMGSATVMIAGKPAARVTSLVSGGTTTTPAGPVPVPPTAIAMGAANVLIGG